MLLISSATEAKQPTTRHTTEVARVRPCTDTPHTKDMASRRSRRTISTQPQRRRPISARVDSDSKLVDTRRTVVAITPQPGRAWVEWVRANTDALDRLSHNTRAVASVAYLMSLAARAEAASLEAILSDSTTVTRIRAVETT